jgi:hypothetical protein
VKIKIVFACALFLLGSFWNLQAQAPEKQEVDSLWWEQKTEQLDYSEEQLNPKNFNYEFNTFPAWVNAPFFKYGVLILITLVLLFVLYKLFGKGMFVNDLEEENIATHLLTESDLDDRFYEMDLDSMLKKSIARNDWAMAIRIRFLLILKLLIDQKQVYWHRDLTNRQIAWQIESLTSRNDFYHLVGYFENVWYGDNPVNADYYYKVSPLFEDFKVDKKQNDKK